VKRINTFCFLFAKIKKSYIVLLKFKKGGSMLMQTWSILATVKELNSPNFSTLKAEIEAEGVEEAKTKVLKWLRKRLKRFSAKKGRFVFLQAAPWITYHEDKVLDADRMLRLRHRFDSLSSIQRVGPEKLFVVGYGPEQAEALTK
jgi:hypothetical protein